VVSLLRYLLQGTPVTFRSHLSPAEAAQKLAKVVVKPTILALYSRESLVGRVSIARVFLLRSHGWRSNAITPVFVGSFTNASETLLRGAFGFDLVGKLVLTSSAVLSLLALLTASFSFALGDVPIELRGGMAVVVAAIFGMTVAFIAIGRKVGEDDIRWISRIIEAELAG
jgi:hypothetical protein